MRCPTDNAELKIADRQGIEVDYCPECRGVWLDRGELDKIIERSVTMGTRPASTATTQYGPARQYAPPRQPEADWRRDRDDDDDDDDRYRHTRKRRKGWLSDLFDFD